MKPVEHMLNRMMTLPFRIDSGRTWREAIAESGAVLNRFFVSLKRRVGSLRYFWTREVGRKTNMVHFHVLIDRYLPKKLLSSIWEMAGGGYVVDIGIVRTSTRYVYKYLCKVADYAPDVQAALSGKRRYSTSQGLLAPTPIDKLIGDWVYLPVAMGSNFVSNGDWITNDGYIFERIEKGP